MDNYPPGTANDPRAPWNQPLPEPYEVLVSITLSKQFTIETYKNEDQPISEVDVRLDSFLPDEILEAVAKGDIDHIRKSDAEDWEVDNVEVMEV